MQTIIYDGREESKNILLSLKKDILECGVLPRLGIFLFGNDPASIQYVNLKKKKGENIGIKVDIIQKPSINKEDFSKLLNETKTKYDGIMIQLPIEGVEDPSEFLDMIPTDKDVDGIHSSNLEMISKAKSKFYPAVAEAVLYIIGELDLSKKKVVVIGGSKYVGKPIFDLVKLKYNPQDITIVNLNSSNPVAEISKADVVVSCIGKAERYSMDILKEGSTLIDVGTSENKEGKIVGDFIPSKNCKAKRITPVPGGVGPLTVAYLLKNTFKAAQNRN